MSLLGVAIFIVIAAAVLAAVGVPHMGVLVLIGVIVFLVWLFQILVRGRV